MRPGWVRVKLAKKGGPGASGPNFLFPEMCPGCGSEDVRESAPLTVRGGILSALIFQTDTSVEGNFYRACTPCFLLHERKRAWRLGFLIFWVLATTAGLVPTIWDGGTPFVAVVVSSLGAAALFGTVYRSTFGSRYARPDALGPDIGIRLLWYRRQSSLALFAENAPYTLVLKARHPEFVRRVVALNTASCDISVST